MKSAADKLEELKSKQRQYLEGRRDAMSAAATDARAVDPLKQYYKTRPDMRAHAARLRKDDHDENLIEDVEVLDSAVKSWEAPAKTFFDVSKHIMVYMWP